MQSPTEQYTLADANCDQLRAGNGLMLLTIMPTLSQTRKQVFEFAPRLRRGQLVSVIYFSFLLLEDHLFLFVGSRIT